MVVTVIQGDFWRDRNYVRFKKSKILIANIEISLKNIENLIDQFYAKISFQIFNLYKLYKIKLK